MSTSEPTIDRATDAAESEHGMAEDNNSEVSVELLDEGPCQKRMKVEVPAETIEAEVNSNYDQLRKTVQFPGFRKGKVPRALLEKRYAEQINDDVRQDLLHSTFDDQVKERELEVLGRPTFDDVHFVVGEPMRFESVFEVAPSFEVPEYKGLTVEGKAIEVSDEEVGEELEGLRGQFMKFDEIAIGEQKADDIAGCRIKLWAGEETLLERDEVYLKIGLDQVDNIQVEGLGDKLLAASEGESLQFSVTLPDDFAKAEMQGKEAELELALGSVRRQVLPELDEAFAAQLGAESVDEVRDQIRKSLEQRRTIEEESRQEEVLVDGLLESIEMDLPPKILEQRRTELENAKRFRMIREGKSEEEVDKLLADDPSVGEEAGAELRKIFILDAIGKREQVFVTEDEVGGRIQAMAQAYNRDPEELYEQYRNSGMLEDLRGGLLREKVRKLIRERATVN